MPEAKYVEDWKDFDKEISFEVVPVWVFGAEEFGYASFIGITKQVHKVFVRILEKQVVFLDTAVMETPGVDHLRMVAVIDPDPTVKNASHHFQ